MNGNSRTREILICLSVVTGVLLATLRNAEADFVFRPAQNAGPVINTALTEIEPTAATFLDAGWDFIDEIENGTEDIWWILEGQDYPRLWWELKN